MADCEVKCITKPNPQSAHEHITDIGNPYANPPMNCFAISPALIPARKSGSICSLARYVPVVSEKVSKRIFSSPLTESALR
jgi:hypothetical protein